MPRDMTYTSKKIVRHEPFDWEKEYIELMDDAWESDVVHCKNCKYCNTDNGSLLYFCHYNATEDFVTVMPSDYCSWGERKA